ncbi:MAG TPA: septal ring lytic transglycosylase RlpA family protein [Solirubrobacteraceae bacterium]|nr:septal ring lytic transglycosylase RlpA family protein [Solirubrobacteraceae bacterium]
MRRPDPRARVTMALGALTTAAALAVAHPAPAPAATAAASASPITLQLADPTLDYGDAVVARGHVPGAGAGVPVLLEERVRGGAWSAVARGLTRAGGAYRLTAHVPRSGLLRVSLERAAVAASGAGADTVAPPSRARGLRVAVHVTVTRRHTNVRAGSTARVGGRVRPAHAGRLVVLQRRAHGRWRTLARTRTHAGGGYALAYRARAAASARLRVRAAGAPALAGASHDAGRLNAFRPALASWYSGGGSLACGGSMTPGMMGVANKSLPCGTMVTIRYRGRQVRVPVVDRGPYVGGREFDLGPGVRGALGFDGVGTVWVSY